MGPVGVHLDDPLRATRERDAEAVDVRASEALLAGAVEHLDARLTGRELVGDGAGAVWRRVVHDEQRGAGQRVEDRREIPGRFAASSYVGSTTHAGGGLRLWQGVVRRGGGHLSGPVYPRPALASMRPTPVRVRAWSASAPGGALSRRRGRRHCKVISRSRCVWSPCRCRSRSRSRRPSRRPRHAARRSAP